MQGSLKARLLGGASAVLVGGVILAGTIAGPAQAFEAGTAKRLVGPVEKQSATHSLIVHAGGKGGGTVPKPTNCQWWFPWYCV